MPTVAAPKAAGAASATAQTLPPGIEFKINDESIPHDRFVKELDDYLGESFRDTFISHVLIEQKAKELHIEATSDDVDAHAQSSVDQVLRERFGGDQGKMEEALKDRGMSLEGWKRRLKLDARYDLLLDKILAKDRKISAETLNRLFEDKYGSGGVQMKLRHILKNVPVAASAEYTLQMYDADKPKIEAEARTRAEQALAKLSAVTVQKIQGL